MFVLSDSNANRAYGTSRGFQLRACNAASSADACSSVSLQVWMVSGFTKKLTAKNTKNTKFSDGVKAFGAMRNLSHSDFESQIVAGFATLCGQ